jgi:GTP-binding protein
MSFRREKYVPKGGPDGGDGGLGGSIILRADRDVASLIGIFYAPHQSAQKGGHGQGSRITGRNGKDLMIRVPCGTEIHEKETGALLGDLVTHGSEMTIANGGKGGLGNWHWKSSTHQAPTEHTKGVAGGEKELRLELKLVSDVSLVGFPNAGKSSLLTQISDAHPKIGMYPFTTLNPIIGTIIFKDYSRLHVTDVPGLITGAHQGVGLGHAFLRHVERSKYLVYVVDMAGSDNREPHEDYHHLVKELSLYQAEMAMRPALVVANKMDLPEAGEKLSKFKAETGCSVIQVSALDGSGVETLRDALYDIEREHGLAAETATETSDA